MSDKFKFNSLKERLEYAKRAVPLLLAKQAENYFTAAFKLQRLGPTKWQEVQRRIPGTAEYKYPRPPKKSSRTSPILVRTGNLRRKVSRSIHEASWLKGVTLIVDLPYAKIHNDGGMTGRGHSVKMPERPFMKQTNELTKMQRKLFKSTFDKIWK